MKEPQPRKLSVREMWVLSPQSIRCGPGQADTVVPPGGRPSAPAAPNSTGAPHFHPSPHVLRGSTRFSFGDMRRVPTPLSALQQSLMPSLLAPGDHTRSPPSQPVSPRGSPVFFQGPGAPPCR